MSRDMTGRPAGRWRGRAGDPDDGIPDLRRHGERHDEYADHSKVPGIVSGWVVLWSFVAFCAAAAGQMTLITFLPRLLPGVDQTYLVAVVLAYWLALAIAFSLMTGRQIRERVERPMREIGQAARRVADGDFSVYVAPRHIEGSRDWDSTDQMFVDFNTMVEELGGTETMKNDFISNVSHEIRNPLAVIKNYATMLDRSTTMSDEQRRLCTTTIVAASERLNALVTNILKLNKLESQTIVSQAADYDLSRQLVDTVLTLDDLFTAKTIELDCDIDDGVIVHADPGIVDLIWSNVLGNALKYTEPGGHVRLTQRAEGDMALVEISDDGCGMTTQETKRIFDKFYQGDTSHADQGNGLGMAMVRRAVDLSRGFIAVRSAKGKGTTVSVRLPLARRD